MKKAHLPSGQAAQAVGVLLLVLLPPWASGEGWMGVEPGKSNKASVRAVFGQPSREVAKKEEGYNTSEWLYEGTRAPVGSTKLVIEFGLLKGQTFQADTVRALTYSPKPNIFPAPAIFEGWGPPDKRGTDSKGQVVFFYRRGLIVTLDKQGQETIEMLFTIEQPE